VSASDWTDIQRCEPDRFNAWTGGKLKIDGDVTLMIQLEEAISKPSK
jgi:hypothetical protein